MKLFKSYMVLVCYAIGNYYVDHNKSENYFVVKLWLFAYAVCISPRNKIDMDKLKQTKNLLKKMVKDEKSVFYRVDGINRSFLDKAKKITVGKG